MHQFGLLLSVVLLAPRCTCVPVEIRGRQIYVDGKSLFLKGVNWNPVPQGGHQDKGEGVHFRGFVETDSDLMAAANINAVRTYSPITDVQVLDTLWQKGIHVMNTIYISGDQEPNDIVDVVNSFKDHPAILMWVIGNEWNYNMLYSKLTFDKASERVGHVARMIKSLDPTHPVATVYGMMPGPKQLQDLGDVDVWGLTAYTGLTFGHIFDVWVSRSDKPMFIAEFGADAFNSQTQRVDEAAQAKATASLSNEIVRNSVEKGGVCIGGFIFELADEWWKDGKGTAQSHNDGGVAPGGGPFPDFTFNEEYWGIIEIDGTPRQAYRVYADIATPRESAYPDYTSRLTVSDIGPGFRLKACGANKACIGILGDCCPTKDNGLFHDCCSIASKQLHMSSPPEEVIATVVDVEEQMMETQQRKHASHCTLEAPVPCCLLGECGSCAGDQCCPSDSGSITCPSASKALADGCIRPKLYDCTGKTGTTPPKTTTISATTTEGPRHKSQHWTGYIPKSTTDVGILHYIPETSTTMDHQRSTAEHHSEVFSIHGSDAQIATLHNPFVGRVSPKEIVQGPTTTQLAISLHTTMQLVNMEAQEPRSWVLGPEEVSCDHVCADDGGCVEGGWPRNRNEFLTIVSGLGYACFDLQAGGGKYDPSTQQGNCGWSWNGGEGLTASATRCAAKAPAFTRRFCPCRSVPKGPEAPLDEKEEKEPDLVIDKFSVRQRSLHDGVDESLRRPVFT